MTLRNKLGKSLIVAGMLVALGASAAFAEDAKPSMEERANAILKGETTSTTQIQPNRRGGYTRLNRVCPAGLQNCPGGNSCLDETPHHYNKDGKRFKDGRHHKDSRHNGYYRDGRGYGGHGPQLTTEEIKSRKEFYQQRAKELEKMEKMTPAERTTYMQEKRTELDKQRAERRAQNRQTAVN